MEYACNPTKDYYVDAYFLLKDVIKEILNDPKDAQLKAEAALKEIEKLR